MRLWIKLVGLALITGCTLTITGCGTIGGTISGAGQDLTKAGNWIKNR